jgi:hypothetical protein
MDEEKKYQEAREIADPAIELVQNLAAKRAAAEQRPVNESDYLDGVAGLFIAGLDLMRLAYPGDEKLALYHYKQFLVRHGKSVDRARGFRR